VWFVLLIISPVTAPFETIALSELLANGQHRAMSVRMDAAPVVNSPAADDGVSTQPPDDRPEGRLEFQGRSAAEMPTPEPMPGQLTPGGYVIPEVSVIQLAPVLRI
jgi:hypothetical protein